MTAIADVVAVIAMLAVISLPVAVAHFGRAPADRLSPTHVGLLVLAIAFLGMAGVFRLPLDEPTFLLLLLMAVYGIYLGAVVLILYGVLERLIRPFIIQLQTPDDGGNAR